MQAKDLMRQTVELCHMVTQAYVADLADADLVVRSVPGANHIAWQMGHLITSTHRMLSALGHRLPELPAGFVDCYTKDTATCNDASRFHPKDQYLALAEQMKAATLAAIDATPEADLEKPGPESMREYAPTVASVLMLAASHWLMHAGQYVPIRRKLGKPAMF